jgi:pimeloyl-ACP methyl ester carboxylesterase
VNVTDHRPEILSVDRGDGRVAGVVAGSGPLVVTCPGMGDLRSTFRFLSPALVDAGFRVADVDLRGHGDSDATFAAYGDGPTAQDLIAVVEQLGGPAVLVGNSMGAAAAVLAAAARPDLVSGLVLTGPFLRNPPASWLTRLTLRLLISRPWAARAWGAYLPKLSPGRRPDDFAEHRTEIAAAMGRPGRQAAFVATVRGADHDAAGVTAAAASVTAPTLVVMGERDPDFADPAEEGRWIADQLSAELLLVGESGHYPHAERPDLVTPAVASFLAGTVRGTDGRADG